MIAWDPLHNGPSPGLLCWDKMLSEWPPQISWVPQPLAQGCLSFGETEEEEGVGARPVLLAVTAAVTLPERPPLTHPPIRQSRLPIPCRGRLILHKTGSGRPGEAAGDARTPCPPGCRQDGQGRPQPGFLCAEYTGQKAEVGSRVTGRSGEHLPLPNPTVPPALLTQGPRVQIPALPSPSCTTLDNANLSACFQPL